MEMHLVKGEKGGGFIIQLVVSEQKETEKQNNIDTKSYRRFVEEEY